MSFGNQSRVAIENLTIQEHVDVSARAFSSATVITGSLATIVWGSESFDTHAALAAGVYTAPLAGKFRIKAALALSGVFALNNQTTIEIQVNGSAVASKVKYIAAAITNEEIEIEDLVELALNDLVRIQVLNNGTLPAIVSSNTRNYFTIERI